MRLTHSVPSGVAAEHLVHAPSGASPSQLSSYLALRARCDFASYTTDAPIRYEHTRSYGKHDASPHYLLGSRPPEIRQCVTAPDASGGRWRVLRFGPFVSEGGWDWHSGHIDDVFRLAQGEVATGFFFSPMSEAGAPLGFPPVHNHHTVLHRDGYAKVHGAGYLEGAIFKVQSDKQCVEAEGGVGCFLYVLPERRGVARCPPEKLDVPGTCTWRLRFLLNDARPAGAPRMSFYHDVAVRVADAVRVVDAATAAAAALSTEFFDVDMKGHSDYPFQTFAIPPRLSAVMWASVTMRLDGEMVMSRPHAHSNLLDLILVFEGTAADVGLDEGSSPSTSAPARPCARAPFAHADDVKRKVIARLVAADGRARLVCAWGILVWSGCSRRRAPAGRATIGCRRPSRVSTASSRRARAGFSAGTPLTVVSFSHNLGATEAYQHTNWRGFYSLRPPSAPRPPTGDGRHRPTAALSAAAFAAACRGASWCARLLPADTAAGTARAAGACHVEDADAPLNSETLYARCFKDGRRVDALHCPSGSTRRCTSTIRRAGAAARAARRLSSLTTRTRRRRPPRSGCRRAPPRAARRCHLGRCVAPERLQRRRWFCAARASAHCRRDARARRAGAAAARARRRRRARVRDGGHRRRTIELDAAEAAATLGWVRRGGGLLLLLDHQPQTSTYAELTRPRRPPARRLRRAPPPRLLECRRLLHLCRRRRHILGRRRPAGGDQPRDRPARVWRQQSEVRTPVGCAFPPVASAAPLLVLGGGGGGEYASWSTRRSWEFDRPLDRRSVAGWWQGAALRVGAGRVVVMCDQSWPSSAAFLKADGAAAGGIFSAHNARFAAATFRWLAGELD